MREHVHVAITRAVKAGCEEQFEQAIQTFFATTAGRQGVMGAQLIRPIPGSGSASYGILRSFNSEEDRESFYQSPEFIEWEREIAPLVEGEYQRNDLHGLEAFFHDPASIYNPPRWKMATVTWLGVWPTVFLISQSVSPHLRLPPLAATAVDTLLVVVLLSWVVMPALTRVMQPWLRENEPRQ